MNDREKNLAFIAMSNIDSICYIVDITSYEILFINKVAKRLLGIKDEEYIGRKCYEVINGKNEVCSFCTNKQLVKGSIFKWKYFNPVVQRYFELTDTLIELDGRNVKLQIGVDITETKNKITQLETKLTLEETLIKCVQTLSDPYGVEIAINKLLATIGEFYNADRAFIFEISNDEIHIANTYEWTYIGIEPQMQKLQKLPLSYFGNWLKNLEKEDSLYFEKLEKENTVYFTSKKNSTTFNYEKYSALGLHGVETLLAAVLKIGSKTIGFLGVDNPKNNASDKSLLCQVSLFISNDLKNKAMLYELERLASVDIFSGLYNRNKYMQSIEKLIADKTDNVGIVYLDINGLKQVNDKYGHEYGDRLILKVVGMMKECFTDNIFRTGGDEFVALCINSDRIRFEEKVLHLRSIMNIQTGASVSIGSAWCADTHDISKQIAHADELMYLDKKNYYTNRQSNQKSYRAILFNELQDAIRGNEFTIFLQPKIRLSDEKVVGAEALVRKKDGQGGLIPPDKFISIYESDGVIPLLDFYVLEAVCEMLKKWREDGHPLVRISVNFSRITILEYNVAQKINNICKKHGIEPKLITIELTEHISNILLKNLNEILEEIKSFGFKISLDDFGREYANLSILSSIAFNEIKLDKSLIDDLASNPATATAIRCIVEMCNAYRPTDMVVEGIETYEQVKKLRDLNCNVPVVQGYYFSKPLPVEAFLQYCLENKI